MLKIVTQEPSRAGRRTIWIIPIILALVILALLFPTFYPRERGIPIVVVEMTAIRAAIGRYSSEYGVIPNGDSHTIFQSLRGQNPRKIIFLEFQSRSISSDGDLLDPWGTPYKLYFSGKDILVRSAGPNKRFDSSREKKFDDYFH